MMYLIFDILNEIWKAVEMHFWMLAGLVVFMSLITGMVWIMKGFVYLIRALV